MGRHRKNARNHGVIAHKYQKVVLSVFYPGIVSVTYRPLTPQKLIALARTAGLCCVEWGGDIHVPHGDIGCAVRVGGMTRGAGLAPISYGTYYRAGTYGETYAAVFSEMLETADALGTSNLRLWAGNANSEDVTPILREALTAELRHCAHLAAQRGKTVSFEYHAGTLTNTAASAKQLMEELGADNASLYWQPHQHASFEDNCADLALLLPYVSNIHVFAWEERTRLALASHADRWKGYLSILKGTHRNHALLLEFTPHDDPDELCTEAETLLSWL